MKKRVCLSILFLITTILVLNSITTITAQNPFKNDDYNYYIESLENMQEFINLKYETKRGVWQGFESQERINFLNQYIKTKYPKLNIQLTGFNSNKIKLGEKGVIGTSEVYIDLERLDQYKGLKSIEFIPSDKSETGKAKIIFNFENGKITTDSGFLNQYNTILNTKDETLDGFKWNGQGELDISEKKISIKSNAEFTKNIKGYDFKIKQFKEEEPSWIRFNEDGHLTGVNIKATVFDLKEKKFVSFDLSTKIPIKIFIEKREEVTDAVTRSLFGIQEKIDTSEFNSPYIHLDVREKNIEVSGESYIAVDLEQSINNFKATGGPNLLLRNGKSEIQFANNHIYHDRKPSQVLYEVKEISLEDSEGKQIDKLTAKDIGGRTLLYDPSKKEKQRAVIARGPRWNPGKNIEGQIIGEKTPGNEITGDFIIENLGRRQMPIKDLYDQIESSMDNELEKTAQSLGTTKEQLIKTAETIESVADTVESVVDAMGNVAEAVEESTKREIARRTGMDIYMDDESRLAKIFNIQVLTQKNKDDIEFVINYYQTKEVIKKWRYQYPAISPYQQLRLTSEGFYINGRQMDSQGLSPVVLARINQGAVESGVRNKYITNRKALLGFINYRRGVR